MRLKGKTALISGAGRNNGKAISLTFAREGADLVLVARTRGEQLNEVVKQCESFGVGVLPMLADVSDAMQCKRVVAQSLERFGKIDVLVSVTGVRPHKKFWEFSAEEWQQVFAVNLHSTFYLAKELAPSMISRGKGGSIIALGGRTSLRPDADASAVTASKHGLHGLIKSLAKDLGPHGIRANLLALSHVENLRLNPEWYEQGVDQNKGMLAETPLGRSGTNQDVANVALFLASDESLYVTGDYICCAGGRQM